MGQYYLPLINRNGKITVYSNIVGKKYIGLKLMEHSYWRNGLVGEVVNSLFYNRARVCWVGDYYDEDNCNQVNCNDADTVRKIGLAVWGENREERKKCAIKHTRTLSDCLLVNHTKKVFIRGNEYYENNKIVEEYEGKKYDYAIHPLPLLTCTASHSGGSYHSETGAEFIGTWFNDEISVVMCYEESELLSKGFTDITKNVFFKE